MRLNDLAARLACLSSALALAACQPSPPVPDAADLRRAETLRPADAQLAQKYERSCLACHSVPASAAPLTGFAAAWQPRLGQGVPTLLAHARDGFRAMPARGYCNDCSDDELRGLIAFMAAAKEGS